jgi:hypothetical protein
MITSGNAARVAEPYGLDRFVQGRLIDESAASAVAH